MIPRARLGVRAEVKAFILQGADDAEALAGQPADERAQAVTVLARRSDGPAPRALVHPLLVRARHLRAVNVSVRERVAAPVPVLRARAHDEGVGAHQAVKAAAAHDARDLSEDGARIGDEVQRVGMPDDVEARAVERR